MNKIYSYLITLLMCIVGNTQANAIAYLVDGIVYTTTGTTGENELLVTSGGNNATYTGAITIPAGMNLDGVDYRVVGIGNYAFRNTTITSIDMPEGLLTIGNQAFANCTSLTSVKIPSTVTSIGTTCFLNCGFTTITLPASLTIMGSEAFLKNLNLTNIVIPDNVTIMGERTFEGCTALKSITVGKGVSILPKKFAFQCTALSQVTFNGTITDIGEWAFSECETLTSIPLPEGLTSISNTAFSLSGITSITLPASLELLGSQAFAGSKLSTANFLGADTKIEYGAFQQTPIESIMLPQNLRSLPNLVFYKCPSLERITLPSSIVSIGESAFSFTPLESITLPQNLTTISDAAFNSCDSLTTVTNASTRLRSVGEHAFYGCRKLTSIELPNAITIGNSAFNACSSLTSINLPAVESLGASAFAGCKHLRQASLSESLTRINNSTFYGCDSLRTISDCENIDTIDASAFDMCYYLEAVPAMKKVKFVGKRAFWYCTHLNWQLPEGLTTIDNYAFDGCKELETTLPSTIEYIGDYAFRGSKMPSYLVIPNATTHLGSNAFDGCGEIDSISFGTGLKVIPPYSFQQLTASMGRIHATGEWYEFSGALRKVEIPNNIEEIGECAFLQCWDVDTIIIGDGVTTIGAKAFYDCYAKYLSIGKSVTTIEELSFSKNAGNDRYSKIICKAANPPVFIGDNFSTLDINAELIVPVGSKEAYQNAPIWKVFTNITEQNFSAGDIDDIENETINIKINGNNVEFTHLTQNDTVTIYNLAGQLISQSTSTSIYLPAGVYIVKINDKVSKINIK